MTSKIKFIVVEDDKRQVPLPELDLDIIDEDDELEKQILIGLGIELHGKNYTVINQVIESNISERNIVYFVAEQKLAS